MTAQVRTPHTPRQRPITKVERDYAGCGRGHRLSAMTISGEYGTGLGIKHGTTLAGLPSMGSQTERVSVAPPASAEAEYSEVASPTSCTRLCRLDFPPFFRFILSILLLQAAHDRS